MADTHLSSFIWSVAELLRGDYRQSEYGRVIRGKLLESETLRQQAVNNTNEQFATSPDLDTELTNDIVDALDAHTSMSTQALNSETVRRGMKDRGVLCRGYITRGNIYHTERQVIGSG